MFANILWNIEGDISKPKDRHAHCQCPFWVTKAVFFLSFCLIGLDQNAEFISKAENQVHFPAFIIMFSIQGNSCSSVITVIIYLIL